MRVEESDSEGPSAKGKPINPAPTKTAPAKTAPSPAINLKKPAVVRSKWDGEDKEEDTPVVSLSPYNQ